jgi:hypothetical protein
MATKMLRWGNTLIASFGDGRACLAVRFLDDRGNLFQWVPRWANVQELVCKASNTEVVNKPDSKWLGEFAKVANEVFQKVEPFTDAFKVAGKLAKVKGGNLVIERQDELGIAVDIEVPPAFRITEDFLDEWLETCVTALVINGFAVRLERSTYDGPVVYPEPHSEPLG